MPKLPRVTSVLFGSTGPATDFGQFGSKTAAAPQTQSDFASLSAFIAGCQALAAWVTGWTAAAVGAAFNPYLEDENGAYKVFSYYINQLCERGVSDWDAGTTYYKGAEVQDPAGSGQRFVSLTDNNLNNALPLGASNAQWLWDNPPVNAVGASATAGTLPKVSATAPVGGYAGSVALQDSNVSDDGTNVKIGLPLKFADGSVQSTASTPISTQTVVTARRALNTVFQNIGTKPLLVFVSVSGGSSGGVFYSATPYVGPTSAPATALPGVSCNGNGNGEGMMSFVVLPGQYYKVVATAGTLVNWTECQ